MTVLLVLSLITNVVSALYIATLVNQRHELEQENATLAHAWVAQFKDGESDGSLG